MQSSALSVFLSQLEQSNQIFQNVIGYRPRYVRVGHLGQSFYYNADSPVNIDWRPLCNASMYYNFTIIGWSFDPQDRLARVKSNPNLISTWMAQNISNAFRFNSFISLQTVTLPYSLAQVPVMLRVMKSTVNVNPNYARVLPYSPISLQRTLPQNPYSDPGRF